MYDISHNTFWIVKYRDKGRQDQRQEILGNRKKKDNSLFCLWLEADSSTQLVISSRVSGWINFFVSLLTISYWLIFKAEVKVKACHPDNKRNTPYGLEGDLSADAVSFLAVSVWIPVQSIIWFLCCIFKHHSHKNNKLFLIYVAANLVTNEDIKKIKPLPQFRS